MVGEECGWKVDGARLADARCEAISARFEAHQKSHQQRIGQWLGDPRAVGLPAHFVVVRRHVGRRGRAGRLVSVPTYGLCSVMLAHDPFLGQLGSFRCRGLGMSHRVPLGIGGITGFRASSGVARLKLPFLVRLLPFLVRLSPFLAIYL